MSDSSRLVIQEFHINFVELTDILNDKHKLPQNFQQKLKEELGKKGYGVVLSNEIYNNIPKSILLISRLGKNNLKDDFQNFVDTFKLPYRPGPFYA